MLSNQVKQKRWYRGAKEAPILVEQLLDAGKDQPALSVEKRVLLIHQIRCYTFFPIIMPPRAGNIKALDIRPILLAYHQKGPAFATYLLAQLLFQGVNPNIPTLSGTNLIKEATWLCMPEIIECLLLRFPQIDVTGVIDIAQTCLRIHSEERKAAMTPAEVDHTQSKARSGRFGEQTPIPAGPPSFSISIPSPRPIKKPEELIELFNQILKDPGPMTLFQAWSRPGWDANTPIPPHAGQPDSTLIKDATKLCRVDIVRALLTSDKTKTDGVIELAEKCIRFWQEKRIAAMREEDRPQRGAGDSADQQGEWLLPLDKREKNYETIRDLVQKYRDKALKKQEKKRAKEFGEKPETSAIKKSTQKITKKKKP